MGASRRGDGARARRRRRRCGRRAQCTARPADDAARHGRPRAGHAGDGRGGNPRPLQSDQSAPGEQGRLPGDAARGDGLRGTTMSDFTALVLHEADGKVTPRIERVDAAALPAGDVTVAVEYSTLNYKDGMVLKGIGRLVRKYPHVPGVDFAGTVARSDSPDFKPGDKVVLTGWRVGEAQWGGYAQLARVKASMLVKLPAGVTAKRAMAIGTAGFTSMMAVIALESHGLKPGAGEVLVTGAAGGVGSVAVAILATLGYEVVASTGRASTHDYLRRLGAGAFIDRAELAKTPTRPLDSE